MRNPGQHSVDIIHNVVIPTAQGLPPVSEEKRFAVCQGRSDLGDFALVVIGWVIRLMTVVEPYTPILTFPLKGGRDKGTGFSCCI